MDNSLANELLQLQKSRSGFKYVDLVDDYVKDIPDRVSKSMNRPIHSFNKNIMILNRYRGRMLYNLEKRFYASLRKLRTYKR